MKKIKNTIRGYGLIKVYNLPKTKILLGTLKAENIFDKNVIPMKTLVKEIGDIKKKLQRTKKFFI